MQFLFFALMKDHPPIPCVTYTWINFACVDGCTAFNQLIQVLKVVLATFLLVYLVSLKENTCETNVLVFIWKSFLIFELIITSSNTVNLKHESHFIA